GGFGMLAYNCIKKPTYHLYHFFAKLKGDALYRDDNAIVVADRDNLCVVSYNPADSSQTFKLSLPFNKEIAFVKRSRVNEKYGNARNAWCAMGRPRFPSKKQVEIIKEASHPETTVFNLKAQNGKIELEYRLDENEVSFFEIMPAHSEPQAYYGLDDSRILTG
ncbi:MAG: xylan 1,4-beta-xylosidase, partial [Defluviitaleaceae bacterium]|nr:xylan 1,4-beta-xylosidase [Defluviitaleaceae bacterium]